MIVLVTGARGMIGSRLVKGLADAGHAAVGIDRTGPQGQEGNCFHYEADLADKDRLAEIIRRHSVERVIHLAALAHTRGETDLSWERYRHINVDCAKNVFDAAGDRPVLYISTVDVFGFYEGEEPLNGYSPIHPVSDYGKSKALAEAECKKLSRFTIFRLSPVYTDTVQRDIQKRYYLKYPAVAYQIGKGSGFEVLAVERAVDEMVAWCAQEPRNDVRIIKDGKLLWTPDRIRAEKAQGRARFVLHIPRWAVNAGYAVLKGILGENGKTYLLNKAVHPLRTE